jgi:hypothetical protein
MLAGGKIITLLSKMEDNLPTVSAITAIRRKVEAAHIGGLPDRIYFTNHLLPAIISAQPEHLLYVGVRHYTVPTVRTLMTRVDDVWTTDIDEAVAAFGHPTQHRTMDITRVSPQSFPVGKFDMIVLNGIIGHGVNDDGDVERLGEALWQTMTPGGLLISGWNTDKSSDPLTLPGFASRFLPHSTLGLAARTPIRSMTHVYDLLERRA